ncbi:hypothetical protein [Psychromonas sp. KJ10-2]|uniref:hypothetical protein n=1 Tax=Psychromonas sp. KJ10-2 TaxID=3391822 RepID=UPI0039B3A990
MNLLIDQLSIELHVNLRFIFGVFMRLLTLVGILGLSLSLTGCGFFHHHGGGGGGGQQGGGHSQQHDRH